LTFDAVLASIEDRLRDEQDLVVIGESYSGPLALRFAARHPGRVRAAVLSASFVLPPLPGWLRWFAFTGLFRIPLPSFLIRSVVAGRGASEAFVDEVRRAIRQPMAEVIAARARETLVVDCTEALRDCRAPILYLAGSRDWLVLPFNLRRILAIRPDVTVRHVDAPHLILQTAPKDSWDAIRQFVESIPPKSRS
jgi:pimeloyl-ACP methyl ester carboxylesterase